MRNKRNKLRQAVVFLRFRGKAIHSVQVVVKMVRDTQAPDRNFEGVNQKQKLMKSLLFSLLLLFASFKMWGQKIPVVEDLTTPIVRPLKLSGPRVGVSYLPQLTQERVYEMTGDSSYSPSPFVSQFGWQFEWRYFETASGSQGLFEIVPLLGGLDQGLILPSMNLLVGYRDASGFEFGAGPNLNFLDPGFVVAVGYTIQKGYMNFPLNFGLVPTRNGTRFTLLVGFNKRDTR